MFKLIGKDIQSVRNTNRGALFSDIIRFAFYTVFSCVFLWAFALCFDWITTSPYLFSPDKIVAAFLYFTIVLFVGTRIEKMPDSKRGITIFAIGLCINLLVIIVMGQNTQQIYDYKSAYATSFQNFGDFSQKVTIFPNWGMYSIYLKAVNNLFCENELTGITLNAFWVSFTAWMLYKIAKRILPERTSVLASLIFAAWPSFVGYIVILSPEYVFVFLSTFAAYFAFQAYDSTHKTAKISYSVVAGIALCFANYFKSVVPIILIAITAILFLLIIDHRKQIFASFEKRDWQKLQHVFTIIISFVIAFGVTVIVCDSVMIKFYGRQLNDSAQSYYMTVGLSSEAKGFYSQKVLVDYYTMMEKNNYDFDEVNGTFYNELWNDIAENKHINYDFIRNKIRYSFGNDDYAGLVNDTIDKEHSIAAHVKWNLFFSPFNHIWYIICVGLIIVSSVSNLIRNDKKMIFYSALTTFGFILLLMISEVQPRYKCVFYPLLSIMAADGVNTLISVWNYIKNQILRKSI